MGLPSPLVVNLWMWLGLLAFWFVAALFANRSQSTEPAYLRIQHTLPLALAYYLVFNRHRFFFLFGEIYETEWQNRIVYPGMLLTIIGIAIAIWARVHLGRYWSGVITLKEGHRVIQTGPYALVRHPIYTGWLTAFIGSAIVAGTADGFVGVELLTLAFLAKLYREEKLLTRELGDEYVQYVKKVPAALIPFVSSVGGKSKQTIESDAFSQAVLRSDKYRAIGMLCICAVFIFINLVSVIAVPQESRYAIATTWWVALALYEGILLIIAAHAQWLGQQVSRWVWIVNTIIECSLPSLTLLGLTLDKAYIGPYRALLSSSLLIYFLFIILSTLRLSPLLCILSGITSAGGYLAIFLLNLKIAPDSPYRRVMPDRTYEFNAIVLLLGGIVAAAVARQIRRHLIAALAEAETRRKLDRIEYSMRTARSIQMSLLPKTPPVVSGYDIAGFSEPADQTGGDYYDWIALSGNRHLFTIADATGHGLGPSLLISSCRAYFRALAKHDDPLERMMTQVDALFSADTQDGRFVTAAVALLDPGRNRLSLYSAGHAPLFLYIAAKNEVEIFDADQPPLGVACENDDAKARTISLAIGDALILVTDGFFEYHNKDGEILGSARLVEFIRTNHALSSLELIRQMHKEVLSFAQGATQADDMTAVVIKRT